MTRLVDVLVPRSALRFPKPSAFDEVLGWLRDLRLEIPDPEPVAFRWTDDGMVDIPTADATEDDLIIQPDRPELEDIAHGVVHMVERHHETFPGPWSWRRWSVTSRLALALCASGVTRSGGSMSFDGRDPYRGPIITMPSWRDALPGERLRPYVLWKADWWWQCHVRQGLKLRGRHRPERPYALGVCAACAPCPDCGAHYDCADGCGCCS